MKPSRYFSRRRCVDSHQPLEKEIVMVSLKNTSSFVAGCLSRSRPGFATLLIASLTLVVLSTAAIAQSVTGTISGVVIDPNGAVVPNAAVTLINDQTKDKRDQPTNEAGRFNFPSLQPGVYTLRIEHQGFETMLRTRSVLSANEGLALGDLTLRTGQVSEPVTVASAGQSGAKESNARTARLTSDQLSLISTKGRDITSLV